MIGSVLATIAALAGQTAESSKPKVDRSGEAAFRAMLEQIKAKSKYHGMILKSVREPQRSDFYPEGIIEIWKDAEKFRVDFGDMWGSSSIVVSDGKQVLEDSGSDPLTLKKSAASWTDSSPSLTANGSASSPWHYLMDGPGLLARLDKDRAITLGVKPNSIVWDSTLFGTLTLTKDRSERDLEVWEIEFDNIPQQEQNFKLFPEWYDAPDPSARWRQKVVLTKGSFPRGVFSTKPGRGRQVQDLRKSGS
ncbi:MAG: hypothetical protein H7Y17_02610 [Chlorobia bacterium]|nr:hypothetical protein [Fimbriimonadaceae bacterium]